MPTKCCTFNYEYLLFPNSCDAATKENYPICVASPTEARANTSSVIVLGIYSLQTLLFSKVPQKCLKMPQNASKCLKMPQNAHKMLYF
jgi:hypothetical protein